MNTPQASTGLLLNEPLLWEKGRPGRCGLSLPRGGAEPAPLDPALVRDDLDFPGLTEVDVVRHYTRLSTWNYGVDTGMYPLGSCTMKYNPKVQEQHAALRGFARAHPLLPDALAQGALQILFELQEHLCEITGMEAASLQPAAGAQGELAGMLILHAWHVRQGRPRTKILVPDTAHGTNPASAAFCGYRPVAVASNADGILTPAAVAALMDEDTAGIMITNPNTLGLFEENIREIAGIVHARGGLVYGDGANMNAILGVVRPGEIGIDILHLNLHKTFSTPHGGGGPGSGPVCVRKGLEPFLPVPRIVRRPDGTYARRSDYPDSVGRLHAFHGHFAVAVRAYSYVRNLGWSNLHQCSQLAVLNANYLKEKLKGTLHLPYDRPCMHECVFSDKDLKPLGVTTLDLAKRLLDHGCHPPTIYFPLIVEGALMVEPTETECKEDLDRFVETVQAIVAEAREHPERLKEAPRNCKVRRLDETAAARNPRLAG